MSESSAPQPISLPRAAGGRTAQEVALECADAAGRIIRAGFQRTHTISFKGRGNVVTETDLAVERAVMEVLRREYPEHHILGEESGLTGVTERWLWIIDPLDGTRNFASGIPYFCFNLALCHAEKPVLAVTYDPLRDERFHAVRGGGAFLNDTPIAASDRETVEQSVVGVDLGYEDVRGKRLLELMAGLFPGMQSLRINGSAALGLAYAAAGRYDLYVHHFLYPWDIAPGILLVQEAGGAVTDRDGGPVSIRSEGVVAGGLDVHADFMALAAGRPWRT